MPPQPGKDYSKQMPYLLAIATAGRIAKNTWLQYKERGMRPRTNITILPEDIADFLPDDYELKAGALGYDGPTIIKILADYLIEVTRPAQGVRRRPPMPARGMLGNMTTYSYRIPWSKAFQVASAFAKKHWKPNSPESFRYFKSGDTLPFTDFLPHGYKFIENAPPYEGAPKVDQLQRYIRQYVITTTPQPIDNRRILLSEHQTSEEEAEFVTNLTDNDFPLPKTE